MRADISFLTPYEACNTDEANSHWHPNKTTERAGLAENLNITYCGPRGLLSLCFTHITEPMRCAEMTLLQTGKDRMEGVKWHAGGSRVVNIEL